MIDESGRAHRHEPTRKFNADEKWLNTSWDPSQTPEARITALEERMRKLEERLG